MLFRSLICNNGHLSNVLLQADRSDMTPEELASETLKHVKARHHSDDAPTNGEERVDAYEASYERDETVGPLKGTGAQEHEKLKERVSHKESKLH